MRGDPKVLAELNAALRAELTAIVQYIVHAEMREDWGYGSLSKSSRKQAIDEMRHAEKLIERILYLDGTPEVEFGLAPKVGKNVRQQIDNDLADERDAVRQYNNAMAICQATGDNGSRELFEALLKDEEGHVDQHEAQLHTIEEIGIQNYLSQQMNGEEAH
jgi:bacterioferritin